MGDSDADQRGNPYRGNPKGGDDAHGANILLVILQEGNVGQGNLFDRGANLSHKIAPISVTFEQIAVDPEAVRKKDHFTILEMGLDGRYTRRIWVGGLTGLSD